MKNSKLLLAALLGGAIGGVIGLLMAPQTGKETRGKLGGGILGELDQLLGTIEQRLEQWRGKAVAEEDDDSPR